MMKPKYVTGRLILSCALVALMSFSGAENSAATTINGAGASFPFPVYSQWAYAYHSLTDVKLNYQSIGSGGGIAQIKAGTVHFGASDAPLKPEELDQFGLIQFPMVMGGVVPVVNIKGITAGELRLDASVLADIFLGQITTWNDPAIAALNSGLQLPDQDITVVHRADGSGTTWIFTNYLERVSSEWQQHVGAGKAVTWPTGVCGKGNEGVSQYVKKVNGAIGYVEFAYALQNNMPHALLKNRDGRFVSPTIETFQSAAENADWEHAAGFYMILVDQPGEKSWPITGASFILTYKEQQDPVAAKAMFTFFDWCYNQGTETAEKLHYVPIPGNVVQQVQDLWKSAVTNDGQPVWQ